MSSSNPTDQFIENRSRLMRTTGGIADNNRRVRLQNFEKAMKAQFGPNVVVSPDGLATRGGKTVGTFDAFIKSGGQLQGTPRDPRSVLQIQQKENEKLAENYKAPTFEERMNTIFPDKKDNRISSKTFEEEQELDLDAMSQYADTEEQGAGDYTDLADLVTGNNDKTNANGTNNTSTRSQLNIGPATGREAMRARNVERFGGGEKGERHVAQLEAMNKDFQGMKKGNMTKAEFITKYPNSQTAKRNKIKIKKK
tara:strand:+ start:56 stop:814 length:759 start_codon:yes stop_codon:yes gene_type:complete